MKKQLSEEKYYYDLYIRKVITKEEYKKLTKKKFIQTTL